MKRDTPITSEKDDTVNHGIIEDDVTKRDTIEGMV